MTVGSVATIHVDGTGADVTWDHVAIAAAGTDRLLLVTPLGANQTVNNGGSMTIAAFDIEFEDPSAP
jgi:hypothetical protein